MKIKNKKGYTLTELLAVIIILVVIMLIAVGSFNGIKNDTLNKQFENTKTSILNDAVSYASDMNINDVIYVTVNDLIEFGYIEPDDDSGVILHPVEQEKKLNCYVIRVIYKNGSYDATFSETDDVLKEGTCANFSVNDSNTNIVIAGNSTIVDDVVWYTSDVTLSVEITGKDEQYLNESTIEWTSLTGAYETGNNILLDIENALNTTYYVTVTHGDEIYKAKSIVKVDKKGPVVLSKDISLNYDSTKQSIKINATDYGGSGINGYAFVKNDDSDVCNTASYSNSYEFDITGLAVGGYIVCVKDFVGNVSATKATFGEINLDLNNTSVDPEPAPIKVLYDLENTDIKLPSPERTGYIFVDWIDKWGNVVYGVTDGETYTAKWKFIDIPIRVIKTLRYNNSTINGKVNIIMVLDHSGSMSTGNALSNLKEVSEDFVRSIDFKKGSTASVIAFESSASILIEASKNADDVISVINGLSDTGGTSFSAALSKTLGLLTKYSEFEKKDTFVIFLSDGIDSSYTSSTHTLIQGKVKKLFTIGVGSSADATTLQKIASNNCGETADSNEVCYFSGSTSAEDMTKIFEQIKENIMTGYSEKTQNGVLPLDGLYVTAEEPVTITVGDRVEKITNLMEARSLTKTVNGVLSFDLEKIDAKYNFDGNLSGIIIEYFFEEKNK